MVFYGKIWYNKFKNSWKKEDIFMGKTPTPHNAAKLGEIAKTVLMPGDPLRAKFIAENYLENAVCFNTIRNMLGFTGTYKGKEVSVMASGMGMPSMGIYSYELFDAYEVDNIMRIGTAGAYADKLELKDVIFGMASCTDSNFADQYHLPGHFAPTADFDLLRAAVTVAEKKGIKPVVGTLISSDHFYLEDTKDHEAWKNMGVLACEMESAALYMNAARLGKRALCIATVSDHIMKGLACTAQERQETFRDMMEIALETAVTFEG